jgi:hypothetical protein
MPRAALWVLSRGSVASEQGHAVGLPLEGFADKDAAEAARAHLERAAREQGPVGPSLKRLLPKGANDILTAAKAAGLPLPDYTATGPEVKPVHVKNRSTYPPEYGAYCARLRQAVESWWALVSADLAPEANAKLWDVLFPEQTFYVVSRVLWEEG